MTDNQAPERIESLYKRFGEGGLQATFDRVVPTSQIAAAFEATVSAVSPLKGTGPFYDPTTGRTPMFDLAESRGPLEGALTDTEHFQTHLWSPPRWEVDGHERLGFVYVDREVTPASAVVGNDRAWVIDEEFQVSADLLLMNTHDRTPIVAEFKLREDKHAEWALVQALAAAAQLAPRWQRKRLRDPCRAPGDGTQAGVPPASPGTCKGAREHRGAARLG